MKISIKFFQITLIAILFFYSSAIAQTGDDLIRDAKKSCETLQNAKLFRLNSDAAPSTGTLALKLEASIDGPINVKTGQPKYSIGDILIYKSDMSYDVYDGTQVAGGNWQKKGIYKWKCSGLNQEIYTNPNSGNSNSSTVQNCNIKFQVPTLPFKYIDNRELCIYCRERYIPYRKIDVNDAKKNRTVSYVVKQVDNHCENVGADNDCKASHMEQITNLFVNNGYYKSFVDAFEAVQMREGVGNLISTYTESIGNLFSSILGGGATNENKDNEFEINLYENNNTKFCTREHEDRYNKKY